MDGKASVYIIENVPFIREKLSSMLEEDGFSVSSFANFETALDCLPFTPPSIIIVDVCAPGRCPAQDYIALARRFLPELNIILITSNTGIEGQWHVLGADACLANPTELEDAVSVLRRIVCKRD